MKKLLFALAAVALITPAFAKTVKSKTKAKPKSAIKAVNIHRTACFGKCPDYIIEIKPDGTTTYSGIRFVKETGKFTKNIGTAKAMEVINMLMEYKIDTCSNTYENRIPDLPGLIYTIQYQDSTKTIRNASFGPLFLKEIAEKMDKTGMKTGKGWKKIK